MKKKDISDEDLAEAIGKSRVTVTRYRNNQRKPEPRIITKIAAALDVKPGQLWEFPDAELGSRPSIDERLKDVPDNIVQKLAEFLPNLLKSWI